MEGEQSTVVPPPSGFTGFPLVEMRETKEKGRHLVATVDLPENTVVLFSPPYTWTVDESERADTCRYCLGSLPPLSSPERIEGTTLPCARCNSVYYCSSHCRARDTREHCSLECKIMQHWKLDNEFYTDDIKSEMMLLLRTLARREIEKEAHQRGEEVSSFLTSWDRRHTYQDFLFLLCDRESFPAEVLEELSYWIVNYIHSLLTWLGVKDVPPSDILDILCRNRRNVCAYGNGSTPQAQGRGVYILPSLLNHSCGPNLMVRNVDRVETAGEEEGDNTNNNNSNVGGLLAFFTAEAVKQGEELTISYLDNGVEYRMLCAAVEEGETVPDPLAPTDPRMSVEQRQLILAQEYFFECRCDRCHKETAAGLNPNSTKE